MPPAGQRLETAADLPNATASGWVARLVTGLTDQAAAWVTDAVWREYGTRLSPRGIRGRMQTRQDIRSLLDFLVGSLATGEPRFFQDYVRWATDAVRARGVPVATLASSLTHLEKFFAERLDAASGQPLASLLAMGLQEVAERASRLPRDVLDLEPPASPRAADLARHLLAGEIGSTRALIRQAQAEGVDYLQIATRLFQPALYSVGRMWQFNEISVAQEHLATAIAQTLLTQEFVRQEFAAPHGGKAVFACVAGNQHTLGLRIVCDGFELGGWWVQYLGADVPGDALLRQLDAWRPEVVCLSASLVQHLPELQRLVGEIRSEMGAARPTILVGGLATNRVDEIWKWIGADVWFADAEAALATGGR